MSYTVKELLKKGLLTLPVLALLSGCGGGSAGSSTLVSSAETASAEMTSISGGAVKGIIKQGIVTAYYLEPDSQGYYQKGEVVAKPVRTNGKGEFNLHLKGNPKSRPKGWALVELTADAKTRMTCDVVPQCEIDNGRAVPFGNSFALDDRFKLSGAVDLANGTVYLTPLSQLAVGLAQRSTNGLSKEALTGAYQEVESWFGLSAGALMMSPPDLTKLDEASQAGADEIQLAVVNAAFLAVANGDAPWTSISDVLEAMMGQVATTGSLDNVGLGGDLALSELMATAALQSAELQSTVASSLASQKLAVVAQRNSARFMEIANVYAPAPAETDELVDVSDGAGTDDDTVTSPIPAPVPAPGDAPDTVTDTGGNSELDYDETEVSDSTDQGTGDTIAANAALLTWTAPFTRENGNSISMGELAGYEIAYGLSATELDQSLPIPEASTDQVLIEDLANGSWYFSIRSIDTDGNMSRWSEVVSKTISI